MKLNQDNYHQIFTFCNIQTLKLTSSATFPPTLVIKVSGEGLINLFVTLHLRPLRAILDPTPPVSVAAGAELLSPLFAWPCTLTVLGWQLHDEGYVFA